MNSYLGKHVSLEKLQWMICFSGFLDLFGVAMLYPLLIHHAKDLGATPSQIGLFGSIYGTLQFFTSPIMGQLSDHYGRRTLLLVSLIGTGSGYFLLGVANSIFVLALARIPSGVFKHSQSMSRTYLADITPINKRSSIFGTFNSISSLGFIIGPTVGGFLSSTRNGFYRVALLSSSVFVLNACFVMLVIPTTNASEKLKNDEKKNTKNAENINFFSSLNAFRDFSLIPWHAVWDVFTVRFLMSFASIIFRSNFTSILVYRFNTDAITNGYITSFNGIVGALTGIMLRWIVPRFQSNSKLNDTFSIITVLSLFSITVAPSLTFVVIMIVPLCVSSAVLRVTNQTAIYHKGGEKVRGLINGLGDTLTSLARAMAPAIAGYAQEVSIYGPGICGTLLAIAGTSVGIYSNIEHSKIQ